MTSAFSPRAALGGAAGIGLQTALRCGMERGMFSHEAGMGSAPIAHAGAKTDDPDRQGLFGIFEVFADTIVICTLTALAILASGVPVPYGRAAGAELTIAAMGTVFGDGLAALLTSVCRGAPAREEGKAALAVERPAEHGGKGEEHEADGGQKDVYKRQVLCAALRARTGQHPLPSSFSRGGCRHACPRIFHRTVM